MNGARCENLSVKVEIVEKLIFETLQNVYDSPEKIYTLKKLTRWRNTEKTKCGCLLPLKSW